MINKQELQGVIDELHEWEFEPNPSSDVTNERGEGMSVTTFKVNNDTFRVGDLVHVKDVGLATVLCVSHKLRGYAWVQAEEGPPSTVYLNDISRATSYENFLHRNWLSPSTPHAPRPEQEQK